MAKVYEQFDDTEQFRPADGWGGYTACAAFINSHLTGQVIQPAEVDRAVGRKTDEWVDATTVNYWLLQQGHAMEEYGDNFTSAYLLDKISYTELISMRSAQGGISEAEARSEYNKENLDQLKPTYRQSIQKFVPYRESGQLVEHNEYATVETVTSAVAVGKLALVDSHSNDSEYGAMSVPNVVLQPAGVVRRVLSTRMTCPIIEPLTDEYLKTWIDYTQPVLIIS